MNTPIKFLIALGLLFILSSCGDDPEAAFTWSPEIPNPGTAVQFTNQSVNASSYEWNFGDSSDGTQTNPVHVYKKPGNYSVKLAAVKGSRVDIISHTVSIIGE